MRKTQSSSAEFSIFEYTIKTRLLDNLLQDISKCTICLPFLELGCRPIVQASTNSRIAIIGQAPGLKVHQSGLAWDDKSGDNLRSWLGVSKEVFYDSEVFALIPMGFCYPGKGKSGDLPPRAECAPYWHEKLWKAMPNIQLTLLVGLYAQAYYLKSEAKNTLTETVKHFKNHLPTYFPLPHPSPRNNIWQAKNEWFRTNTLPELKNTIQSLI